MLPAHGYPELKKYAHLKGNFGTAWQNQQKAVCILLTLLRLEDEMVMPPEMKFSRRELEILKWTAEGKTSAEVAMILSISENTVNFHQKNMQRKFNAPNKTQIACYAVATGLI